MRILPHPFLCLPFGWQRCSFGEVETNRHFPAFWSKFHRIGYKITEDFAEFIRVHDHSQVFVMMKQFTFEKVNCRKTELNVFSQSLTKNGKN